MGHLPRGGAHCCTRNENPNCHWTGIIGGQMRHNHQPTLNPRGEVQVAGERWTAVTAAGEPPIPAGKHVEVVQVEGVRLIVKRWNN